MSDPDSYEIALKKGIFDGRYTATSVVVTLSIALALYNSLEMFLLISTTFKRWRGLYFWSLAICNFGVFFYALGIMLSYFDLCVVWLSEIILDGGWLGMIICQSLVLYSRLGLILDNPKILRSVKWMIIIVSISMGGAVIILDFGNIYVHDRGFAEAYYYMEHIQMTGITIEELLISGLYVWKTIALLKVLSKANTRTLVWQLLAINIAIMAMDTALIVLQYKHLQLYQESIKGFVYSVKLKLELNILSKLVALVDGPSADRSTTLEAIDGATVSGRRQTDVRSESSRPDMLSGWATIDEKGPSGKIEEGFTIEPISSSSLSGSPVEKDEISRVVTHPAESMPEKKRRNSDDLYADFLRSM